MQTCVVISKKLEMNHLSLRLTSKYGVCGCHSEKDGEAPGGDLGNYPVMMELEIEQIESTPV